MRMIVARALAVGAALVSAGAALAQHAEYPDRPVKIIVPFAAGGPTDVVARLITQKLSEKLGQQFYIENLAGAGGNIAMGAAARAPADGYTILFVSSSYTVNPSLYAKAPYDPKDFAPVTKAGGSPNGLFVNPSIPAKSVNELVELIRANPGKYTFASPGIGTTPHLSSELFKLTFRLDFALALVGMPVDRLPLQTIRRILEGGESTCAKAGIPVAGVHTIDSIEPIYGLVAIGQVDPRRIKRNAGARAGDALVLGKPLGIGIYSAALKKQRLSPDDYAAMLSTTTQLNTPGTTLGSMEAVHAMTDVTGFGLIGHLLAMCRGSAMAAGPLERRVLNS